MCILCVFTHLEKAMLACDLIKFLVEAVQHIHDLGRGQLTRDVGESYNVTAHTHNPGFRKAA